MTLYELLEREITRMISGMGMHNKGNIHPLITQEIEKYIIEIVLRETGYNHLVTSRLLGIGRTTLYRKIENLSIQVPKKIN